MTFFGAATSPNAGQSRVNDPLCWTFLGPVDDPREPPDPGAKKRDRATNSKEMESQRSNIRRHKYCRGQLVRQDISGKDQGLSPATILLGINHLEMRAGFVLADWWAKPPIGRPVGL